MDDLPMLLTQGSLPALLLAKDAGGGVHLTFNQSWIIWATMPPAIRMIVPTISAMYLSTP
jgi:hypothetical protein